MKPKLILLNGSPGMGKTTLAQRYVDEHPLALNLDIDNVWMMMGQWQASRPTSDALKYKYAHTLAAMHLAEGYDVIVPNSMDAIDRYHGFERVAAAGNAALKEVVLLSDESDAIERCKTRGRARGYADGFRPGGILDSEGRESKLARMHQNILATIALRPDIVQIQSVENDIAGTYAQLLTAVK